MGFYPGCERAAGVLRIGARRRKLSIRFATRRGHGNGAWHAVNSSGKPLRGNFRQVAILFLLFQARPGDATTRHERVYPSAVERGAVHGRESHHPDRR